MRMDRNNPLSTPRWMLAAVVGLSLSAAPALAQTRQPPANAVPLSTILQTIEQQGELAWFDEIEWDDDGYWEIEYYAKDGSKRRLRVDPATGKPRR